MRRPTRFHVLLKERGWDSWEEFSVHFVAAARDLARKTGRQRLATIGVGQTTFDRWAGGVWSGRPRADAAEVLEHLLGIPVDELFGPARTTQEMRPPAAEAIERRWPSTSRLVLMATRGTGVWELTGRDLLDGTAAAVNVMKARPNGEGKDIRLLDPERQLDRFLQPVRRGFLLGVDEHNDPYNLYVLDGTAARRTRVAVGAHHGAVSVPRAYLLDDFTYGLVWFLTQLDDGLQADDHALDAESGNLDTYLALPRSAPSRLMLDLTAAGTSWWGSAFCAHYIERQLREANEVPAFWTREQSGSEAGAWLFFRHKVEYLQRTGSLATTSQSTSRVFCIPEASVTGADRHERVLLLLAIALMEHHGIRVRVTADPAYEEMDGIALIPGQRAVIANWVRVRGEALWIATTTSSRSDLRSYTAAFGDAQQADILTGVAPGSRLEQLARYLDIDWEWVTSRSRELAEHGVAGLVRPRSRLLTLEGVEDALSYLGGFTPEPRT